MCVYIYSIYWIYSICIYSILKDVNSLSLTYKFNVISIRLPTGISVDFKVDSKNYKNANCQKRIWILSTWVLIGITIYILSTFLYAL